MLKQTTGDTEGQGEMGAEERREEEDKFNLLKPKDESENQDYENHARFDLQV